MNIKKNNIQLQTITIMLFIVLGLRNAVSQNIVYSPAILSNFSSHYLDSVRNVNFNQFSYLIVKYMKSYKIDSMQVKPKEYDPNYSTNFNVKDYEHNRLVNDRFTRKYEKYGFILTLLSESEIISRVAFFNNNPSLIDFIEMIPPVMINTGNPTMDTLIYRKKNQAWEVCKF